MLLHILFYLTTRGVAIQQIKIDCRRVIFLISSVWINHTLSILTQLIKELKWIKVISMHLLRRRSKVCRYLHRLPEAYHATSVRIGTIALIRLTIVIFLSCTAEVFISLWSLN